MNINGCQMNDLRNELARECAMILIAAIANSNKTSVPNIFKLIAEDSYVFADEMIKQRKLHG
jgi:hypothetical protein